MRVNAKVIDIWLDADAVEVEWQTENNDIIESFLIRDNFLEFVKRFQEMNFITKDGINKEAIKAATFNVSTFFEKGGKEIKIRPESIKMAGDVKYVYVEPSNVTAVTVVPPVASSKTAPVVTRSITQPAMVKNFSNKEWAAKNGKIGAVKYQNKLALKRAQEPINKLRERIETLKFNCSPAFIETCNQFTSMLNTEIRNMEK